MPENPCARIFEHKWLDPQCVESGCQSLKIDRLTKACKSALEMIRSAHGGHEVYTIHVEDMAEIGKVLREAIGASKAERTPQEKRALLWSIAADLELTIAIETDGATNDAAN